MQEVSEKEALDRMRPEEREAYEKRVAEIEAQLTKAVEPREVRDDRERPITAAELKLEMTTNPKFANANLATINWEKLAEQLNEDRARRIKWDAPAAPKSWTEKDRTDSSCWYFNTQRRLRVHMSCGREQDGRRWVHLSVSHPERIPTWGELGLVKEAFLGDAEAYQVLPPKARYVNIHPHCLNLYALAEPDAVALPDFTRGTGSI